MDTNELTRQFGEAMLAQNNLHHTKAYRNEQDFYDTNLGRGKGDPDIYGYPGEVELQGDTATITIDPRPF